MSNEYYAHEMDRKLNKKKTCTRHGKEVECDLEYNYMTGEIECNTCYAHSNWSSGPIGGTSK